MSGYTTTNENVTQVANQGYIFRKSDASKMLAPQSAIRNPQSTIFTGGKYD